MAKKSGGPSRSPDFFAIVAYPLNPITLVEPGIAPP